MNRQAMLSLTASVALCEAPETRCELSINRQLWQESDTANRQVLNGDFVHLRIEAASPSQELHMALCEQESADAQRYVFGRSPSRSSQNVGFRTLSNRMGVVRSMRDRRGRRSTPEVSDMGLNRHLRPLIDTRPLILWWQVIRV